MAYYILCQSGLWLGNVEGIVMGSSKNILFAKKVLRY